MKLKDITQEQFSIYVGLLTIEQKEMLIGQLYNIDSFFNPIQDNFDNWIISIQEINSCNNYNLLWVKDLELIIYVPKELINQII